MPKRIDLTGERFGRLAVVGSAGHSPKGQTTWWVICDCGETKICTTQILRSGHTASCGCLRRDSTSTRRRIDLTGMRFGRLVVVHLHGSVNNKLMWVCLCDCGTTKSVRAGDLRVGSTESCGCLRIEQLKKRRTLAIVGYDGAHCRVRAIKGRASEHLCVDCGAAAGDWSYDGLDPQELTQTVSGSVLSYSLDIAHYQPRCKSCHTRFDRAALVNR